MPTILKRRSTEVTIPEGQTQQSAAIASLIATVADSPGEYAGMSHREFREFARTRSQSCDDAWSPIRTAALVSGH